MRIVSLFFLLFLASCGGNPGPDIASGQPGNLNDAQAYCLTKGYAYSSFDFNVCYNNRPQVQEAARNARLASMSIITQNRSTVSSDRSVPVE
jgi:hypothetical protein